MREWWRYHVEDRLSSLPVNWDTWFLGSWVLYALHVILSGGRSV